MFFGQTGGKDVTARYRQPFYQQLQESLGGIQPQVQDLFGQARQRVAAGPGLGPEAVQSLLKELMAPTYGQERFGRMAGRVREQVLGPLAGSGMARQFAGQSALSESLTDLAMKMEEQRGGEITRAAGMGGALQSQGIQDIMSLLLPMLQQQGGLMGLYGQLAAPGFTPTGPSLASQLAGLMSGAGSLIGGIKA
jgi:hypothetical protein